MKTITKSDQDLILDLRADGAIQLPPGILEKDILLTEAIQAINEVSQGYIGLVFCGGTCLSKAYKLIDRMSEDVDFKIISPEDISKSARSRLLSQYKNHLLERLVGMGFIIPTEQIVARDGNNHISMSLYYESRFPAVASLRPEIQVELNARPPRLATRALPIKTIVSEYCTEKDEASLAPMVQCIGIEETLSEKALSFLRRTAEAEAGRNRGAYDERLVRHLYDVKAITDSVGTSNISCEHFADMVKADAVQFRNQYPEFEQDPVGQMMVAMDMLKYKGEVFAARYQKFVRDLVFGDAVPFDEARSAFLDVASRLISAIEATEALANQKPAARYKP